MERTSLTSQSTLPEVLLLLYGYDDDDDDNDEMIMIMTMIPCYAQILISFIRFCGTQRQLCTLKCTWDKAQTSEQVPGQEP